MRILRPSLTELRLGIPILCVLLGACSSDNSEAEHPTVIACDYTTEPDKVLDVLELSWVRTQDAALVHLYVGLAYNWKVTGPVGSGIDANLVLDGGRIANLETRYSSLEAYLIPTPGQDLSLSFHLSCEDHQLTRKLVLHTSRAHGPPWYLVVAGAGGPGTQAADGLLAVAGAGGLSNPFRPAITLDDLTWDWSE